MRYKVIVSAAFTRELFLKAQDREHAIREAMQLFSDMQLDVSEGNLVRVDFQCEEQGQDKILKNGFLYERVSDPFDE